MPKQSNEELELELRELLRTNFVYYAQVNLKIRTKSDGIQPLEMNQAQLYVHNIAEKQMNDVGYVRIIVLKGRQQGMSTYIQGRFYWKITHAIGKRAFILTHEGEATKNLLGMTSRYHEHCNELIKPSTSGASLNYIRFDKLDSEYRVGTAGNKNTGVSSTNQYLHGSEVALWENAGDLAVGLMQTVPDARNTEIWYESTARGMGNYFHKQWVLAEKGETDFIPVFVPWYWQSEYQKLAPLDFEPEESEMELQELFRPYTDLSGVEHTELTLDQIHWRRIKIKSMESDGTDGLNRFKQEYPMNPTEAFQSSAGGGLIDPLWCMRARKQDIDARGHVTVGIDPSFGVEGGDRFSLAARKGREIIEVVSYSGSDVNTLGQKLSKCLQFIEKHRPTITFIDSGGGSDICDALHDKGYPNVIPIAFGSTADNDVKYGNKRAEMWGRMALWLNDENTPVQIPDSDSLQTDLCGSLYKRDLNHRLLLLPKDQIKKELGFSPDEGDACALTFAQHIPFRVNEEIIVTTSM